MPSRDCPKSPSATLPDSPELLHIQLNGDAGKSKRGVIHSAFVGTKWNVVVGRSDRKLAVQGTHCR